MTALELIGLVNQVLFIGLFVAVLVAAVRQPTRTRLDALLLFGSAASVVILGRLADWLGFSGQPWVGSVTLLLLNVAPLAMLRLVDDFSDSPRWVQMAGLVAFVAIGILGFILPVTNETVLIATMAFLVVVGGYAAVAFARQSQRTRGITRRRMTAVTVGAGAFIAALLVAFVGALDPDLAQTTRPVTQLLALVAVSAFFLGFTPPRWVRLVWRDPDVRRFLERSTQIIGVTDDYAALTQMQAAAADAFGANGAVIGVAVPERGTLRYAARSGWEEYPDDLYVGGRAFTDRRRVVVLDSAAFDPENVEAYRRVGARTVIASPIVTDGEPLGVLTIFASRAPIFAEDDLWLLDLLASHTGVLLEARALSAQASDLRAREDAARLKEEFISAAAHDLRTPLTVVLGQAELLQRRILRRPNEPPDPASIGRIVREAHRLRDLVTELLDAQRLEESRAVLRFQRVDLRQVVQTVVERHREYGATLEADLAALELSVEADTGRMEQVVENLVENALKYGGDAPPSIRAWAADEQALVSVVDHGIGIPEPERERVFERFFRASNAHSITDTGIGLGLYICRRIVEAHGGGIWFEPTPGGGSTFTLSVPIARRNAEAHGMTVDPAADAAPPMDAAWNPTPALSTDSAHADA
ncbi:MAG TPA: GAF domain-containing sensor histidine kinase [Candidatus Limnocylindria bacterium]|nr:GAF domain-containing sensor histidine kinase [Candidatus Limnocylindria bacterium]